MVKRTGTKRIKTERLVLRKILPTDFIPMLTWYRQPEIVEFFYQNDPHTVWDAFRICFGRITKYHKKDYYKWAIIYKGRMAGMIELDLLNGYTDKLNVCYILDKRLHSRGIMSEALSSVFDYMKTQGFNAAYARCDVRNIPSKRVMEKSGMTSIGDPETNRQKEYENGTFGKMHMYKINLQ